jgi:glycosyltransferase 2 family protein
MKRPWLKVLPWLLLGVLLVYVWVYEPFDWHAAWAQAQDLPALLWAQLLAVFVLSYAARIGRWVLFTRALGVQVPLWHNAVIYMAGFGMGLVLNKLGEAMRSLYLKPYGLHPASGLSAFVVDRLLDVLVAGTFAVLGMVWWNAPAEAAYAVTAVGLLGLLTLRSRWVHRWIGRIPMGRLRRHQQRFMRGLSTLLAGRTLAWGTP